jgi:hypothetical protein
MKKRAVFRPLKHNYYNCRVRFHSGPLPSKFRGNNTWFFPSLNFDPIIDFSGFSLNYRKSLSFQNVQDLWATWRCTLLGWLIIFNSSGTHHKNYLTMKQLILNGFISWIFWVELYSFASICGHIFLCFLNQPIRGEMEKYCFLIGWIFGKTCLFCEFSKIQPIRKQYFSSFSLIGWFLKHEKCDHKLMQNCTIK